MSVALDHWIFGNGCGLKSPYFDNTFYWLSGQFYTWMGGFGAQLVSRQWRHPKPGERRRLNGREYVVFLSRRRWCRVEVSWALVRLPDDTDAAYTLIREIKRELDNV